MKKILEFIERKIGEYIIKHYYYEKESLHSLNRCHENIRSVEHNFPNCGRDDEISINLVISPALSPNLKNMTFDQLTEDAARRVEAKRVGIITVEMYKNSLRFGWKPGNEFDNSVFFPSFIPNFYDKNKNRDKDSCP
jgi:hypothetical protein